MRMKTLLTILLTAIVFIAAATLGVTAVYRVSAVTLEVSVVSEEAKTEAELLEKALSSRYKKESMFSVKEAWAKEEFAHYPYFRMISFKRSYPNRLIITATEDPEVYALENTYQSGYYILGGDGTVLCEREMPFNRTDGKANVILTGITVSATLGRVPTETAFVSALAFCRTLDGLFGGLRGNVVSLSLNAPVSAPEYSSLKLIMREGATVNVFNPFNGAEKKAESFYSFYKELGASQRLSGRVDVTDFALENGAFRVTYSV